MGKATLVTLPAVASFCGTILAHFRLRESWELRPLGQIDVDEAIVKATFLPIDDPEKISEQLYQLEIAHIERSRLQTARFFATLSEGQGRQGNNQGSQKS